MAGDSGDVADASLGGGPTTGPWLQAAGKKGVTKMLTPEDMLKQLVTGRSARMQATSMSKRARAQTEAAASSASGPEPWKVSAPTCDPQ